MKKEIIEGKINELLDDENNLIGANDMPSNGPDMESFSGNKTTDYNAKVSGQNFKNDFLGRFGFYFYESAGEKVNSELLEELAKIEYDQYHELITQFLKDILSDKKSLKQWTEKLDKGFDGLSKEEKVNDYKWAKKSLNAMTKHMQNVDENGVNSQLSESEILSVVEDILTNRTNDRSIGVKGKDKMVDSQVQQSINNAVNAFMAVPEIKRKQLLQILIHKQHE